MGCCGFCLCRSNPLVFFHQAPPGCLTTGSPRGVVALCRTAPGSSLWVGCAPFALRPGERGACALPSAGSRCGVPFCYRPYHTHGAGTLSGFWAGPFSCCPWGWGGLLPWLALLLVGFSWAARFLLGMREIQSTGGRAWHWPNTPAPAVIQPVTGCGH